MIGREEAKQIEDVVREAGAMILSTFVEKQEIHQKAGPANFVTDYDVRIQKLLIEKLSTILPSACYFGEEETNGNGRAIGEEYTFFIDPRRYDKLHVGLSQQLCECWIGCGCFHDCRMVF